MYIYVKAYQWQRSRLVAERSEKDYRPTQPALSYSQTADLTESRKTKNLKKEERNHTYTHNNGCMYGYIDLCM